jgi:hypothetical protein
MSDTYDYDDQDQSEVFDEDNTEGQPADGREVEFKTFEELPDVFDVTSRVGDARDIEELDAADFDEDAIDDEDLEEEDEVVDDDVYDETDEEDVMDLDEADGVTAQASDEVEIVYQADVTDRRGAQSSAAHFESRGELETDDLEDLGYVDEEGDPK